MIAHTHTCLQRTHSDIETVMEQGDILDDNNNSVVFIICHTRSPFRNKIDTMGCDKKP